jgi:hypothetical protein
MDSFKPVIQKVGAAENLIQIHKPGLRNAPIFVQMDSVTIGEQLVSEQSMTAGEKIVQDPIMKERRTLPLSGSGQDHENAPVEYPEIPSDLKKQGYKFMLIEDTPKKWSPWAD